MLAEYFIGQKQGRLPDNSSYKLSEVICNFTLAGMHPALRFINKTRNRSISLAIWLALIGH